MKNKKDGVGLGLSISNELAQKINGVIGLESDGKTGSTFCVTIYAHISKHPDSGKNNRTQLQKTNTYVRLEECMNTN